MPRRIELFYGIGSRYSYLAAAELLRIAAANQLEIDWRPLNSVRFLRERGNSPFDRVEQLRGQYDPKYREEDAKRWAALYGIPFHEPRGRLELDSELLARAATMGVLLGKGRELTTTLFSAVFHGHVLRIDRAECSRLAVSVGIERAAFEGGLQSRAPAALEANMRRAHDLGVFGVPTFIVDGQRFWGNDRLPLLEHWLRQR